MAPVVVAAILALPNVAFIQDTTVRIEPIEAYKNGVKLVQAQPITQVFANWVVADLVVAATGTVESVRIVRGNPAHAESATAAFTKWRFSPIVRNGRAVRFVVEMSIHVPDTPPAPEVERSQAAHSLLLECQRLVSESKPSDAEVACLKAVEAADKLRPEAILDRSWARTSLGDAFRLSHRWREALAEHLEAAKLDERVRRPGDVALAVDYRNIGITYFNLGEFIAADSFYSRAVTTIEVAVVNVPGAKDERVAALSALLIEHARVKRALGQEAAASALEKKARRD